MGKKYKMTGCARIFIILIILAPLAYIGASYFNGEDGLSKITTLFQGDGNRDSNTSKISKSELENQISKLEKDVQFYVREVTRLEQQLADCQNARN